MGEMLGEKHKLNLAQSSGRIYVAILLFFVVVIFLIIQLAVSTLDTTP